MALSDDKTRVLVTLTKDQKAKLAKLAAKDKRSLSNMCAKIITDYLDKFDKRKVGE